MISLDLQGEEKWRLVARISGKHVPMAIVSFAVALLNLSPVPVQSLIPPLPSHLRNNLGSFHSDSQLKYRPSQTDTGGKLREDEKVIIDGKTFDDANEDSFSNWIGSLLSWTSRADSVSKAVSEEESDTKLLRGDPKQLPVKAEKQDDQSGRVIDDSFFLKNPLSRVLNIETLLQFTDRNNDVGQTMPISSSYMPPASVNVGNESVADRAAFASQNSNDLDIGAMAELSAWNKWAGGMWQRTSNIGGKSVDFLVSQATGHIESLVSNASSAVSSETVQSLVLKSSYTLRQIYSNQTIMKKSDSVSTPLKDLTILEEERTSNYFVETATKVALARGLDMSEAADRARETAAFAASLLSVADGVLRQGYVKGDPIPQSQVKKNSSFLQSVPIVRGSKALFSDFTSAFELNSYSKQVLKSAEMGALSGAIYEEMLPRSHKLGHSIVATGTTLDVFWMVTDSIADQSSFGPDKPQKSDAENGERSPFLVRTITVRGFDASDEKIDRERLLNRIVAASPETLLSGRSRSILAHSGLLEISRAIFADVKPYIEGAAPTHKIIFNGHSVGGSISLFLLLLMTQETGSELVRKRVARVYMFGSPPVLAFAGASITSPLPINGCHMLEAFDLPETLVHSFVQPWDPIVRLFSEIDALYPLVEDVGEDGNTPWANGPYRTLRPIMKAIIEAWNGWPTFRDIFREEASQTYVPVGVQHILLPDPTRYLADRFLAVNIPVPPVAAILRISSVELYPALEAVFPLDVFEVSFIPQGIRSFVHHFYPAYGFPIMDYVKEMERRSNGLPERTAEFSFSGASAANESTSCDANMEQGQASWLIN